MVICSVNNVGLVDLIRYLATYLADKDARFSALSLGRVLNGRDEAFEIADNVVGHMAEKEKYRAAVRFLCSNQPGYMDAQKIVMDGGGTTW